MKPNWGQAIIPIEKVRDYLLNPNHPTGKNKARVFASLGISQTDAETLRGLLLKAVLRPVYFNEEVTLHGIKYTIQTEILWEGKPIRLVTGWIVRYGESFPRFTTAYPSK